MGKCIVVAVVRRGCDHHFVFPTIQLLFNKWVASLVVHTSLEISHQFLLLPLKSNLGLQLLDRRISLIMVQTMNLGLPGLRNYALLSLVQLI